MSQTFDAWREALQFESFGRKNEQQKPNQTEEAVQVHPSSAGAEIVSSTGAQRGLDTPMEMLSLTLLGGRLSLSVANAFN